MFHRRGNQTVLPLDTEAVRKAERIALGTQDQDPLNALCLSGGGIRSAAFCLGVIHALGKRHLLGQFHYLSTVSGGGYIGAWLTRCIAQIYEADPTVTCAKAIAKVEDEILTRKLDSEPVQLRHLRRYTDYLTPHPGLLSLDTWAGIMLWLRNTLINWSVFFPLMLGLAAVPVLYAALVRWTDASPFRALPVLGIPWLDCAALACLAVSVFNTCHFLPSRQKPKTPHSKSFGLSGGKIFGLIVIWTLGWAFIAPLAMAPFITAAAPLAGTVPWQLGALPVYAALVCIGAYCVAGLFSRQQWIFWRNLPAWALSSAGSAVLLWLGAWLAVEVDLLWIIVLGPVWVLTSETIRSTLYVALRTSGTRTDLDREWLARLSGSKLRVAVSFAVLNSAALLLPMLIFDGLQPIWARITSIAAFLSGPIAAKLGAAAQSAFMTSGEETKKPSQLPIKLVIGIATTVFAATLFMLLGALAISIAGANGITAIVKAALLIAACGILAYGIDTAVNLNRFSMHAVYRNRLVRAFLGSARTEGQRQPDRFTDFDPRDNVRVADSFAGRDRTGKGGSSALFPVINATLNVTSGKNTARAERKGEPFTMTPLHCGSGALHGFKGAYVETACYAGADKETGPHDCQNGVTLGTAMTLSGAAVSPDMGYQSSPFTAFLMTLFNVRLGAWLPNPGAGQTLTRSFLRRSGPRHAIPRLLSELAGQSDDRGKYVYLSDGGHFDNLGLYEMLRRRCALILVIDAGCDEHYDYSDLGRALQQALIDMNVQIEFPEPVRMQDAKLAPYGYFASITYAPQNQSAQPTAGHLVYLKPWLPDDAPTELKAFKARKASFPHENTLDQFFTESDFESYRRLGEFLTSKMIDAAIRPNMAVTLEGIFDKIGTDVRSSVEAELNAKPG